MFSYYLDILQNCYIFIIFSLSPCFHFVIERLDCFKIIILFINHQINILQCILIYYDIHYILHQNNHQINIINHQINIYNILIYYNIYNKLIYYNSYLGIKIQTVVSYIYFMKSFKLSLISKNILVTGLTKSYISYKLTAPNSSKSTILACIFP